MQEARLSSCKLIICKSLGDLHHLLAQRPVNILRPFFQKTYFSLKVISQAAAAKSLQSCPTLCDPIEGSPPGSPIPGILQARTLEWVAISISTCLHAAAATAAKLRQSCPTLCDPIEGSPTGSSVPGIL